MVTMVDYVKLKKAIELLKTVREDARLALSGDWDRSDKGFQAQLIRIDEFLSAIKARPKGKLKQGKLNI